VAHVGAWPVLLAIAALAAVIGLIGVLESLPSRGVDEG